jgi:N-methylhydantoinase A/oxoprolinase/acetone carboxylase beta subunit
MFAEGFGPGEYEVEAWLVGEQDGGEDLIAQLGDTAAFPASWPRPSSVELELRAVKSLRSEGSKRARFVQGEAAKADGTRNVLTRGQGRTDVPVYRLAQLKPGDHAAGPAILEEDYFTCRVLDGWSFVISDAGDILLNRKA